MNSLPRKKRATFDRSYPWAYYFQDWEPVVLKENNRTAEKNERRLKIHATLRIDSCNNLYCVLSPSLSFSLSFRHFLYLSSTNIHAHSNIRRTLFPFSPWILSLSIFLSMHRLYLSATYHAYETERSSWVTVLSSDSPSTA